MWVAGPSVGQVGAGRYQGPEGAGAWVGRLGVVVWLPVWVGVSVAQVVPGHAAEWLPRGLAAGC